MLRFILDVDCSMSSYSSRFTHRRALGGVAFIVTFLKKQVKHDRLFVLIVYF